MSSTLYHYKYNRLLQYTANIITSEIRAAPINKLYIVE